MPYLENELKVIYDNYYGEMITPYTKSRLENDVTKMIYDSAIYHWTMENCYNPTFDVHVNLDAINCSLDISITFCLPRDKDAVLLKLIWG